MPVRRTQCQGPSERAFSNDLGHRRPWRKTVTVQPRRSPNFKTAFPLTPLAIAPIMNLHTLGSACFDKTNSVPSPEAVVRATKLWLELQ